MNAPCHGWQVSKQAMDGLPEKTERHSIKKRAFSGPTIYVFPDSMGKYLQGKNGKDLKSYKTYAFLRRWDFFTDDEIIPP